MSRASDSAIARHRLEAQRAQAEADISGVEAQVEAGELDPATAAELISRYRHEIAAASVALGREDKPEREAVSGRRTWAGAGLLVGAFVVAGLLAAQAVEPRQPGNFITGGSDQPAPVNLDEVTNEQMEAVIAANPDVPEVASMRTALANRYFEAGDFSAALEQYLEALAGQLGASQRAQALGRVGWMTYLSGRTDLAQQYVEEALTTDSGYGEGTLFLALIELYGNDDAVAAQPLLERLAARDDLPADIRAQIEEAMTDAASRVAGDA